MTPEQLEAAFNKLKREFEDHRHTGSDGLQVEVTPVLPNQGAITAADSSVVDVTYGADESAVITNTRTRVQEIEDALIAVGILS